MAAFHGSPEAAQRAGLRTYNSIYGFRLSEKADIVIASANPMYTYLGQCLKAIIHASMLSLTFASASLQVKVRCSVPGHG